MPTIYFFLCTPPSFLLFFFNDTATTEIYTLSLHDALPIYFLATRRLRSMPGQTCSKQCRARFSSGSSRSEEHTSELQSHLNLVCRLLLEKKKHTSELQSHLNIVCRLLLEKKNIYITTILLP